VIPIHRPPLALIAVLFAASANAQQLPSALNDYPTDARAEYVFTCMAVNGNNQDMLRRCSCSIDVVASILPYERYVQAETVLAMRQVAGERVGIVRETAPANEMVRDLRRAQAEADMRCF
jgi:hypothetical protein